MMVPAVMPVTGPKANTHRNTRGRLHHVHRCGRLNDNWLTHDRGCAAGIQHRLDHPVANPLVMQTDDVRCT